MNMKSANNENINTEPSDTIMDIDKLEEEEIISNELIKKLNENSIEVDDEIIGEKLFVWKIENWSELENQKEFSASFEVGGYNWGILLFPKGNTEKDFISIFLNNFEVKDPDNLPDNWHVCAKFVLAVHNYYEPRHFNSKPSHHRFNKKEGDWGFNRFIEVNTLYNENNSFHRPLIENDKLIISVYVQVYKDVYGTLWHDFLNWDSKKETGYVGFKNQGATCYMNSLLQALFFINYFRKATYQIPTENDEPTKSIPLALQRVFYNLQHSDQSVDTRELTKSFGWDTMESFMQHDIQEFNRELQDNLENKMKHTAAEGAISKLFRGKMKSYIDCININYTSSRIEEFYGKKKKE